MKSPLTLQAANTASLSAGSGIAGGISGRETCVWVSQYTQCPLCGQTFRLSYRIQHSDKRSVKSLLKDVSAGKQKETLNWSHTYVFPPRPFRNGLKCAWKVQMIFSLPLVCF